MNNDTRTKDELAVLLSARWYTLDQPWVYEEIAGTVILAGSPDPRIGKAIADCQAFGELEHHSQCAIAAHIVDAHNKSLEVKE